MTESWERTDGVVTIRPPQEGDATMLIAGRDAEFDRFLGPGSNEPEPIACVTVDGKVVGWVDHDADRSWLLPGEVNVGYNVFASHRGRGIASRAVQLLMHHLAVTAACDTATLLIHRDNLRSRALAERNRFVRQPDLDGHPYYKRPVPPVVYAEGDVTIRRRHPSDLEMDLSSRDEENFRRPDLFDNGPRWTFSVDVDGAAAVGVVDVDLASDHAAPGDANVSYWVHPDFRRRGIAQTSISLAMQFIRDHTSTRRAYFMVDPADVASLAVAAATGATVGTTTLDRRGRTLVRHTLDL